MAQNIPTNTNATVGENSADSRPRTLIQGNRRALLVVVVAVLMIAAALLLIRNVARFDLSEAMASVSKITAWQGFAIVAMAIGSYACLTGFDWLALKYVGRPLPYRRAALASFTALSLGHNIGFAALSSGAIRYRFYSRWGLTPVEIAKLIVFCGVTVGLGLITLGGIALLIMPDLSGRVTGLTPATARLMGSACLAIPVAYLWAATTRKGSIKIWRWSLEMPPASLALAQILLGTLNFALVAACLYHALNAVSEVSYPAVVTAYVLANSAAIASHVPGGLGVIEAAVLLLLPDHSSLTGVIIFRLVYYLLPLAFGLVVLLVSEIVIPRLRNRRQKPSQHARTWKRSGG